jgi:hypothetical protein
MLWADVVEETSVSYPSYADDDLPFVETLLVVCHYLTLL